MDFLIKFLEILQEAVVTFFEFLQSDTSKKNKKNKIKNKKQIASLSPFCKTIS